MEGGTRPIRYRVVAQITRRSDAFVLCMDNQTLNFTPFKEERYWRRMAMSR
ncbi:succinylglutamate desuccinylase [Citrobacter koseri]|uniref:Succinylglutamate desuccinylase n=1 Tax=Citrobacter koseri TaxID=545 RepID=A0A447UVD0_CITKO|nr:succinylglutamate desuccinylase [Citrobacter koseri]